MKSNSMRILHCLIILPNISIVYETQAWRLAFRNHTSVFICYLKRGFSNKCTGLHDGIIVISMCTMICFFLA